MIARSLGVDQDQHRSSHIVFSHPAAGRLSLPAHRPIKPVYIRLFLDFVGIVGETNED